MRTRLDEIVEEYFGPTYTGYARNVAERAFRHGVERDQLVNGPLYRDEVQPARADNYFDMDRRSGQDRRKK